MHVQRSCVHVRPREGNRLRLRGEVLAWAGNPESGMYELRLILQLAKLSNFYACAYSARERPFRLSACGSANFHV